MTQMNVAMYYNNRKIVIEKQEIPIISDDELLIKVMASGICGSDVMEWYRIRKAPVVLGHEIAGEIVKKGKRVEDFELGDRVFATHHVPCNTCVFCLNNHHTLCATLQKTKFHPGGFAEYLRLPAINVDRGTFRLPDQMSYDDASFIEPLACVVRGFRIAGFQPAQTVAVLGAGIAGLLNIKLARAYSAARIFVTDITPYRLEMAKKMGADYALPAEGDLQDEITNKNQGDLADLVVLSTGALSAAKQAFQLVKSGGTLLLFAPTNPGDTISLDVYDLWKKQIKLVSTYAGVGKDITDAMALLSSGQLTVADMITHRLPLSEAQEGFTLVADAASSLKVILYPHQS